jgi:hypothetical protein
MTNKMIPDNAIVFDDGRWFTKEEIIEFVKNNLQSPFKALTLKEEKKDKDWEILLVLDGAKNVAGANYGVIVRVPENMEDSWIKSGARVIQIKRLSDNSIWTVSEDTPKGKIELFELPHPDGQMYVRYDLGGWDYLSQCKKLPPQPEKKPITPITPITTKEYKQGYLDKADKISQAFSAGRKTIDTPHGIVHEYNTLEDYLKTITK